MKDKLGKPSNVTILAAAVRNSIRKGFPLDESIRDILKKRITLPKALHTGTKRYE